VDSSLKTFSVRRNVKVIMGHSSSELREGWGGTKGGHHKKSVMLAGGKQSLGIEWSR